jgi:hypothetical protein
LPPWCGCSSTATETIVGLLLGIGLSWSLLRAKATGQIEVQ